MAASSYAHPEALVDTNWAEQHKDDPNVRIAEVDVDTKAYQEGHIPGAVGWDWQTQLSDPIQRDLIPKADLEKLQAQTRRFEEDRAYREIPLGSEEEDA